MLRNKHVFRASVCSMVLFGLALAASSANAVAYTSPIVGHAYVNDNTAGANTVAGFNRHADGSLTPIPGSPFHPAVTDRASGWPRRAPSSSRRRALPARRRRRKHQISVLRLGFDGIPQPSRRSHLLRWHRPRQHRGLGQSRLRRQRRRGARTSPGLSWPPGAASPHLQGSTVPLPGDGVPGDVLFNPTGHRLVVTLVDTLTIASYDVGWDGRLVAAPGSPFPAQGPGRSAPSSGRPIRHSYSSATPTASGRERDGVGV